MDREEALDQIGEEISDALWREAENLGLELTSDALGVAAYAAERADHLSRALGEPGYAEALMAERDALALKVAIVAVERADEIDVRILAVAHGALAIGARALRILAGIPPMA